MAQREVIEGVIPRMEYARRLLNYSQERFAKVLWAGGIDVHSGTVERWLRDVNGPPAQVYEDICFIVQRELKEQGAGDARRFKMVGQSYYVDEDTGEPTAIRTYPKPATDLQELVAV